MNDDSHFSRSLGVAQKNAGKEYYGERCIQIAAEIERLQAERDNLFTTNGEIANTIAADNLRLRAALKTMVYETTHLSSLEDDGSHKCRISKRALAAAREALAYQQSEAKT
jgi:hypothetical protein